MNKLTEYEVLEALKNAKDNVTNIEGQLDTIKDLADGLNED